MPQPQPKTQPATAPDACMVHMPSSAAAEVRRHAYTAPAPVQLLPAPVRPPPPASAEPPPPALAVLPALPAQTFIWCEECGNKIRLTSKFCSKCGSKVAQ
jgi:hypothetical protein